MTIRVFTSGSLSFAPPTDWDLLPPPRRRYNTPPLPSFVPQTPSDVPEAGPSCWTEPDEVILISSDDEDLPEIAALHDQSSPAGRSSPPHDYTDELGADTLHFVLDHLQDKLRRVVRHPSSPTYSFLSMHGVVKTFQVKHETLILLPDIRPNTSSRRDILDDACLLSNGTSNMIITGRVHDEHQLSACVLEPSPLPPPKLDRPWNKAKRGGVSSLTTMMQPNMFASGGYDHTVHLWEVKSDLSSAKPQALAIKHHSVVQALLSIRDTSHKLISGGADCTLSIYDLASQRVTNTVKTSNIIYNLHSLSSPFCTLLEVAHRDMQFEVRDYRLVPEKPVHRFGYNCLQVPGRFIRGASLPEKELFACGDREGHVRVWDLRNTRHALHEMLCLEGQKIVQVLFHDSSTMLACGFADVLLKSI